MCAPVRVVSFQELFGFLGQARQRSFCSVMKTWASNGAGERAERDGELMGAAIVVITNSVKRENKSLRGVPLEASVRQGKQRARCYTQKQNSASAGRCVLRGYHDPTSVPYARIVGTPDFTPCAVAAPESR